MIDDDFHPNRLQLRALGHLLVASQNSPQSPALRESVLYERVYERFVGSERQPWLDELAEHGLVRNVLDESRVGDRIDELPIDICLTPAGIYYAVSRAPLFGESARTPTDDFPDAIVDAPWAIHAYYSSYEGETAPAADSYVRFDHNQEAYLSALDALDAVTSGLKADNEIGANNPEDRDHALAELRTIRRLLEEKEGWTTKLIAAGWGALGYVMTQFADRPVAYLADQAWHALQAVIGLR